MDKISKLSSYVIIITLPSIITAYAAKPIFLQHTPINDLQKNFNILLPGLQQKITKEDTLEIVEEHLDDNQFMHTRMQQKYKGFAVFGGDAILHSDGVSPAYMSGIVYQDLVTELGNNDPEFIPDSQDALEKFKAQYPAQLVHDATVTPIIYINNNNQAFWAYKVSILVIKDYGMPERPTAIIDAKSGKYFAEWNNIKTLYSLVKGIGYGGNHKTGSYQFGRDLPFLEVSRDDLKGICYMENPRVKVVDMDYQYDDIDSPMKFRCEQNAAITEYWTGYRADGYDNRNGAFSPSNDALYIGDIVQQMYRKWYHINALSRGRHAMQLIMRVHFGRGYGNAFWDGRQMTFGDGNLSMYPLVSMTIGAHEISHGFTEQHSNLYYFGQSGAMNESFSDMAAQTALYYARGENTWTIGSEVIKDNAEALRFMDEPSRDGKSIDNADEYSANLDVHYSSGVYNHLFYLMATTKHWNPRKAFHVMLKANRDYWTSKSTFREGACGILAATRDLKYSLDDVERALEAVNIDYDDCVVTA